MEFEEKPIQDDQRENQFCDIFSLTKFGGKDRNAKGLPDAVDEDGRHYELKSTTKGTVSTARDFGINHLYRYLKRYWLVGIGRNLREGFCFDGIYFLAPIHLQPWFEKLAAELNLLGTIGREALDRTSPLHLPAARRLVKRGSTLNDPKLPLTYVRRHGIKIVSDHARALRDLVTRFPIEDLSLQKTSHITEFFVHEEV